MFARENYVVLPTLLYFVVLLLFLCCQCQCKVCPTMDVRNVPKSMDKLRNCTEIQGNLMIVLMETVVDESAFDPYTFPELKKISGYLLFFRIRKLTSVAKLFPNLRVIGGSETILDYSLIIYDMPDIKEIGTDKLLYIAKGSVKVDRCPNLCYVDTIDWNKIGADKLHYRSPSNSKCERCPRYCDGYCWNAIKCQVTDTEFCHKECLGCSQNLSASHCHACKNFEDHGLCVKSCPEDKVIHSDSFRCLTADECRSWKGTWWVFGKNCVNDCPPFYEQYESNSGYECRFCGNNCTRHCRLKHPVESKDKLEHLKGCTHINGSLNIYFKEDNIDGLEAELTANLGSVVSISGNLVIRRTKGIRSLSFLQKLRYIGGEKPENGKYSVFIYENQNLRKLWNFSDTKFHLKINNGIFAFHNNPYLCLTEVEKLAEITGLKGKYTKNDVSQYSNGDNAACATIKMDVEVKVNSSEAVLKWKPFGRKVIGYTIFYKPEYRPETVVETCVNSPWESNFTSGTNVTLTKLEPFTNYSYYIRCSTDDTHQETGVKFFKTKSHNPDEPRGFKAEGIADDTINLSWVRPLHINGKLLHFVINYDEVPDMFSVGFRNYCEHPRVDDLTGVDLDSTYFTDADYKVSSTKITTKVNDDDEDDNCTCIESPPMKSPSKNSFTRLSFDNFAIQFKDRRYDNCSVSNTTEECEQIYYQTERFSVSKRDGIERRKYPTIYIEPNITSYNLTNLKHFTMYAFYLSACNEPKEDNKCSPIMHSFSRTQRKVEADDIQNVEAIVFDQKNVDVFWSEPSDPNGLIVAYRVKYENEDLQQQLPTLDCIAKDAYFNESHKILSNLSPGNYKLTVQAESVAGLGSPSKPVHFVIVTEMDLDVIIWPVMVLVISLFGGFFYYWWYKKKYSLDGMHLITSINPDYDGVLYVEDEWEIDRNDIEIQSDLGHGAFGKVFYGRIKSKNMSCAIKTVNEGITLHECMEFLNEASVMKTFSNCHHVVRLLGVVSKGQPSLVVMELMERGDLKQFLRRTRDSSHSLTSNEIYRMAIEIADGMAYLAAKKFVHRDLAARNCMVAGDRTVKIGDFGMTRDIYENDYYRKETKGLLPVRWMAPESLADGVFTSDSDVWSYGIVLWEIATLAEQPYQGLSNEQVLQFVVSKGRLERPGECSDLLYEIMRHCWCWKPNDRLTFWDIVEQLENSVSPDFKLVSFIHSREGLEHRLIHGRQRPYNAPAISTQPREDLIGHYNVSDDEVSLHVGGMPRSTSYLHSRSLARSNDSRTQFGSGDLY